MDDGRPPRAHGCHHEVLGRADALEIQNDLGANEPVGRGRVEVSVVYLELDAKRLEARDVHVELARPDLATARHGDDRASEARDERAENRDGGAHLGDELIGSPVRVEPARVYEKRVGVLPALHRRADGRKDIAHDIDIGYERHVFDARLAGRHHACRHELEYRVFGATDLHRSRNGTSAVDDNQLV